MSHLTLIKKLQQVFPKKQQASGSEVGFSLLELIVVVLMIGILSAIAAPGWLAFVNRQRVAKVNDAVFSSLQDAQRQAKRTKRSYSVSFKYDKVPKVAVYLTQRDNSNNLQIPSNSWKKLGESLELKEGQITLCSNIKTENEGGNTLCGSDLNEKTITFDYQGNLAPINGTAPTIDTNNGLAITAAIPQSNNPTNPIPATARCVKVKTLIGSMQTGQGKYDQNSNPQGCPVP